jgi:biopolymer transport protein ExbD
MNRRESPEINVGSMADIAFLLLIFFLVTTTMEVDLGIPKRLPQKITDTDIELLDKNVLEIHINAKNEIMVEDVLISNVGEIKQLAIDFIDNGGGTDKNGNVCDWCKGRKAQNLSDHPDKAVITIKSSRNSSYATYISVQNEVLSAYTQLRNNLSANLYGKSFEVLLNEQKLSNNTILTDKVELIKNKYPQHLIEEDPIK